jgi:SAM-dependent methyltransferase
MSETDRARWTARYAADGGAQRPPSPWVIAACARLPAGRLIIDIAAGDGRHAVALARTGHRVVALDIVEAAIRRAVREEAGVLGLVSDVQRLPLRPACADAVLVTNFLEREIFDDLKSLLGPGGIIVYETYTREHLILVESGRARAPRGPDYLLQSRELLRLVAPFTILDYREGYVHDDAGERYVASVVAERPREG